MGAMDPMSRERLGGGGVRSGPHRAGPGGPAGQPGGGPGGGGMGKKSSSTSQLSAAGKHFFGRKNEARAKSVVFKSDRPFNSARLA